MKADKGRISWLWGRFEDSELEREYLHYRLVKTRSVWRGLMMGIAVLFLLLMLGDMLINQRSFSLGWLGLSLGLFAAMLWINLYVIDRQKDPYKMLFYTTLLEALFIAGYFITINRHQIDNIAFRAFEIIFIIISIYLVPNHFSCTVGMAACSYAGFLVYYLMGMPELPQSQLIAMPVYLLFLIVLCTAALMYIQISERENYYSGKRLQEMLMIDPLTGAYNLRKMSDEMEKWLPFCARYDLPFSIITIDVDDFKQINDTKGHLHGDQILKDLVRMLLEGVREQDIVVRAGGDELIILLPNTDGKSAEHLAQRLLITAQKREYYGVGRITCSMGVAAWKQGMTAKQLRDLADQRLYIAKRQGKNRVISKGGVQQA